MKKAGFEPAIFQYQVKRSSNWAIQPSYRKMQHFTIVIDMIYITKYKKGNKHIIYLEIMKYAFMQNPLNYIFFFFLDFEFFHHFPPSRVFKKLPAFIWYYSRIWPVWTAEKWNDIQTNTIGWEWMKTDQFISIYFNLFSVFHFIENTLYWMQMM